MDDSFAEFLQSIGKTDVTTHVPSDVLHSQSEEMRPSTTGNNKAVAHQQSFYPTPNSAAMHAITTEKQFMSPFPAVTPVFMSMGADTSFNELDELLFTPMLSPAMTPMQQYQRADLDWDQFDQSLFSLTSPAIDESTSARTTPQSKAHFEHVAKKQRIAASGSKLSRQTSPSLPQAVALAGRHKRNLQGSEPTISRKEHTPESSNDGISPVNLETFSNATPGSKHGFETTNLASTAPQPITPSMLMSIQARQPDGAELQHSDGIFPEIPMSLDLSTASPYPVTIDTRLANGSTAPMAPPPVRTPRTPGTPATVGHVQREIRPRLIASAHARSKSATSSPALGPHEFRQKTSPDLRPILPGGMSPQVGAMLASKSNYQHIVDGTYDQLNITYPEGMTQGLEVRRTSHKAAEQKRRDHLKECFEQLRMILPDRPDAAASKVVVLKKGYEHIVDLHESIRSKDAEIARLKALTPTGMNEESNGATAE